VSRRNSSGCGGCSSGAGGARTPACRVHTRVNAKLGVSTRPRIFLHGLDQSSPHRVSFDIPRNAIPLVLVSNPMIVRLPLPKRFANAIESFIRLPRSRSLDRFQEQSRRYHRQQEHVNVIRHDDERSEPIVPQLGASKERIHNDLCDRVLPQECGTSARRVQIPVNPRECFTRSRLRWRREFSDGQASIKRPGYEQPAAFRIAMRETAAGVHKATSALSSPKISRSHDCERGTQECVRHECL